MAEALARASAPPGVEVFSAGSKPSTVHQRAIHVMGEIGIDITNQQSKGIEAVPIGDADVIITLCAEEECPVVSTRAKRVSWLMPDPASVNGSSQDELDAFRSVRDDLARRIRALWSEFPTGPTPS